MGETYLRDQQVAERLGVARITVWRWAKDKAEFPKPIKLSSGCTRWKLSELEAWEAIRAAA